MFSFKLYKEAMRKLVVFGVVFTAMFFVIFLPTIVEISMHISDRVYLLKNISDEIFSVYTVMPYFAPVALAFTAFDFLFKRNKSDFFHSIPFTRAEIFISFFAAVLTYMLIIIAIPTGALMLQIYASGIGEIINLGELGVFYGEVLLQGLMFLFAALSAVSITGTTLTGLILSYIIALVPRYTYTMCKYSALISIPYIENVDTVSTGVMLPGNSSFPLAYVIAYSCLLAVCAFLLFKRRKSELAGNVAPNRFLQTVYAAAVGFPVTLLALTDIMSCYTNDTLLIWDLGFAFVVVVAFELISSHTIRTIKHGLLAMGIVILADAVLLGAMSFTGAIYSRQSLSVAGVRLKPECVAVEANDTASYFSDSYGATVGEKYVFTDSAMLELVQEIYDDTVNATDGSDIKRSVAGADNLISLDIITPDGASNARQVLLSDKELEELYSLAAADEKYVAACTEVPKDYYSVYSGSEEVSEAVIASFFAEAQELTPEQLLASSLYIPATLEKSVAPVTGSTIELRFSGDGGDIFSTEYIYYESVYNISAELFPNTYALLFKELSGKVYLNTAGDLTVNYELSDNDAEAVENALSRARVIAAAPNCLMDYSFTVNFIEYQYHTDCGTFYWVDGGCSFVVGDEDKEIINNIIREAGIG